MIGLGDTVEEMVRRCCVHFAMLAGQPGARTSPAIRAKMEELCFEFGCRTVCRLLREAEPGQIHNILDLERQLRYPGLRREG